MTCPHCQQDAKFVGYRDCRIETLLGKVTGERAYYHCPHCHRGSFPMDAELGLEDHKTSGARQVITLVGTLGPFAEGAEKVLHRLTGLSMSASTVQRTTEAVGEDVAQRRAAGETFGPAEEWDWHPDSTGQKVAYVSLDATGVPQQGPKGKKRECRMALVAAVYNPRPKEADRNGPRQQTRYVSGLMSLPEIGAQLRRECQQVGVFRADVVVGLSDGGNGLEDCLLDAVAGLSPRIEIVLDFYHAVEHLRTFARSLDPVNDERRSLNVDTWSHRLKHSGGRVLLEDLQSLDLTQASPAARDEYAKLLTYLGNNVHRTDYPTYVARGWQIGSGTIESACKTVIGQRMKQAGMGWGARGTTALCQLRALFKSTAPVWDAYWSRQNSS